MPKINFNKWNQEMSLQQLTYTSNCWNNGKFSIKAFSFITSISFKWFFRATKVLVRIVWWLKNLSLIRQAKSLKLKSEFHLKKVFRTNQLHGITYLLKVTSPEKSRKKDFNQHFQVFFCTFCCFNEKSWKIL